VVYELGSILSEINLGKSGVDLWIRAWMEPFGIGQLVILPLITAGILLHWHHGRNDDWRIRPSVLAGMLFESSGLGLILFFAGRGLFFFDDCSTGAAPAASAVGVAASSCWATTIGYIGCGVYEELFFRLILLNSLINVGRRYFSMRGAPLLFTLLTSLIFSGLHYELFNPAGPAFEAAGFLFRFAASCVFCLLFFYRGFGIAVGTHTIYDVLTQF
jgi:membrane protease YdiL (CAAX protease family)